MNVNIVDDNSLWPQRDINRRTSVIQSFLQSSGIKACFLTIPLLTLPRNAKGCGASQAEGPKIYMRSKFILVEFRLYAGIVARSERYQQKEKGNLLTRIWS